jgi:hypothetical protein
MSDEREKHPGNEGLPGKQEQNREEHEPTEPVRRGPTEEERGGGGSGGEAGEGSQSTGNPDSAG